MARNTLLGAIAVALAMVLAANPPSAAQADAVKQAAASAAKASPELVNLLAKEIGGSPDQAAGAAGALFGLAKSRLQPDQFAQVSKAVPGMDMLLKAAPALGAVGGGTGAALAGLASMSGAFQKLGLSPSLVTKAIPVLTSFVTKSGGAGVGALLAGVLK